MEKVGHMDKNNLFGYGSMLDAIGTISDVELLRWYERQQLALSTAKDIEGHLQQEIFRRMDKSGGTMIPSDEFICEDERRNTYDQAAFKAFGEIFSSSELAQVFTAAHVEEIQVGDKWDTRKVISLAKKYGDAALRIIDQARLPGERKLRFSSKQKEKDREEQYDNPNHHQGGMDSHRRNHGSGS